MGRHSTEHPPDSLGARSIIGATQKVTGFEPATETEATDLPIGSCENVPLPCAAIALQTSGTKCPCVTSFDANLQRVIEAWVAMTDEARRAVLDLIDATSRLKV
jgi:hypothetical protein